MKYLNKIIFINSANIPYAEISVDGNVHFTGTQGVGKSTVLRALLFFYNADKHRLGIQQGQKSFDEFYFRQSNSHILYEVMRDNGAYTILVSRYQGRASWRFIDAPYQREWLIDEDRQVLSDWVKIRERIDKNVVVSARIDSGVMFKDIIFGNTHDHKYTRYALVQSSHYQNIPRSIQNVFLNTKLDADFVKNTIIQSMADEDLPIDLQTYRRLVTDFEREYDEIDCWFRQTRDGNYPVRQQALKIAEQGRKIVALDQQLNDIWRMLNYAVADMFKLEQEAGFPFNHIHATGSFGKEWMPERVKNNGVDYENCQALDIREYIYNMPTVMAAADVIISRAGAATCNEIGACGTPCILIPSPNVTNNHQEKNARVLEAGGGAVVVLEKE